MVIQTRKQYSKREVVVFVYDLELAHNVRRLRLEPCFVVAVPPEPYWGDTIFIVVCVMHPVAGRVATCGSLVWRVAPVFSVQTVNLL